MHCTIATVAQCLGSARSQIREVVITFERC
jgi:hypothetical protein